LLGKTLAHYDITDLLGKGGMGEVYRALDTKLGREVAIKILPTEFSGDPERAARFDREARTLASLQHPNVASIYGFEEVDGIRFLVMELVEGDDLAERLKSGGLPWKEAVDVAEQIAEGLEAAHAQDIVHRDLKPANIKITPTRDVKILDFGLARAYAGEPDGDETDTLNSPTITAAMTQVGTIMGTAAYMSPEQARGRGVDKQSDIWSFGVVLYEMLTGECLFKGETVSDSIGAILHRDPDLDQLPDVPPQVRTLLRRTLIRDKRKRLRDIGDARLELEEARSGTAAVPVAAPTRSGKTGWLAALAMTVLAAVLGTMFFIRDSDPGPTQTTLGLSKEEAVSLSSGGLSWSHLDVSPDGTSVVYRGDESNALHLRDIGSFTATKLIDTEQAKLPVFSPDGRWIAYFGQSGLWKIAVSGGAPVRICDTERGPGLTWGQGELYFSRTNGGGLWAVSENGGEIRSISTPDASRDETSHRWPQVLPGGRHLLLTIKTARIATFDDASIGLLSLDTGQVTVLMQGGSNPHYVASGHLVYGRGTQLFAAPFDLKSLTVTGTPTPVLDGIHISDITGSAGYALSPGGDLVYVPSLPDYWDFRLVWWHRSGKTSALEFDQLRAFDLAVSPDEERFVAAVPGANDKLWIYDLRQKTTSRLTNTPGNDRNPVWSPDGRSVAYRNDIGGPSDIFLVGADGSAPAERLHASESFDSPSSWSPDGSRLLFTRIESDGNADIWSLNMSGEYEAEPFLQSPDLERDAQFSPGGEWVAYVSDTAGDREIYVRPYPGPGNALRVSRSGGTRPFWAPDGSALYFTADDRIMEVPFERTAGFRPGEPVEVFVGTSLAPNLNLAPIGDRFLATLGNPDALQFQIRVIFDWADELNRIRERQ
jgi:serine/threonine-protein kinase